MKFCKKCVQPDTRPGIFLNKDGICSACIGHEEKIKKIDWKKRKKDLEKILNKFRSKNGLKYDCIIPVSGGKDSTYQVYMMKKVYRMNPLAITYRYADRTVLGQENLDNLRMLGVDHVDFSPNPEAEKKFIKKTLFEAGDPCIPDHMGIFTVTLRSAVDFNIPLIVWGENPQLEYGGSVSDRSNPYLDKKWLSVHGTLQGKMVEDWVDRSLKLSELTMYKLPSDQEFKKAKISSIFLGYYLPWDPLENYKIAKSVGFKKSPDGPKMGIYDFADIDSTNMIVHHYIKLLKFGMSRLNDNLSVEIRNKRITRENAIKLLKTKKERIPIYEIKELCRYLGMKEKQFWKILEKFRNKNIWKKDKQGRWYILGYPQELK